MPCKAKIKGENNSSEVLSTPRTYKNLFSILYLYFNIVCTIPVLEFSRVDSHIQGHPTNLFLTLSVPQRNLAAWQKYRCFDDLAGKFCY